MAGGITTVQEVNLIGAGNGYVMIGTAFPVNGANGDLQDMGALEGETTVTISRETLEITDGNPEVLIEKRVIAERAQIKFTLLEKRVSDILKELGLTAGHLTTETAATEQVTNELKTLHDTTWAHLEGTNILATPAPSVTGVSPTTTTFISGTDYEINRVNGTIRRIASGSIAEDGQVYVTYQWSRPSRKKLDFGGDTDLGNYVIRFVYTQADGNRQITDFYKVNPAPNMVQAYRKRGLNGRDAIFDAIADPTKASGQWLYRQYFEGQ